MGKQHLEENYRFMLEEKDELIKVLQTQVSSVESEQTQFNVIGPIPHLALNLRTS